MWLLATQQGPLSTDMLLGTAGDTALQALGPTSDVKGGGLRASSNHGKVYNQWLGP